jgi:hypothetical protein
VRAARPIGTEIQPIVIINGPDELERAFVAMERERADAVVIQGVLAIKPLTELAIKYRMPTASTTRVRTDRWENSCRFRGPTWSDDHHNRTAAIALPRL